MKTFIAAFNQLVIQFALLEKLSLIGFGGLSVSFALAFGLGGRDVMNGILSGYYVRQRIQAGDRVILHLDRRADGDRHLFLRNTLRTA